jgi:hypothetical protein
MTDERDILQRLAELNPVPPESVAAPRDLEAKRRILDSVLASVPRRRRPRRVAGAVAAVMILAGTALFAVLHSASQSRVGPMTATAVLRNVAMVASTRAASGAGDVEYTQTSERSLITYGSDQGSYSVVASETKEQWVAPDGSGFLRTTSEPDAFVSSADQVAWQDAGSPDLGRPGTSAHAFAPSELHYQQTAALPTDVGSLAQVIQERVRDEHIPQAPAVLGEIGELLAQPSASPALRASLYRVAADLPDVKVSPGVTDDAGRQGIGVSIEYLHSGLSEEESLIFDPQTSALLERREVYLEPGALHVSAPFTANAETFLDEAMVGSLPTSKRGMAGT